MNENHEIAALLREGIAASNRTTRAVRAFVRFLFIQLSGTTLAGAFIYFGSSNVNVIQCATSGDNCEPNMGLIVLGVLIWIVGVVWSSSAGWSELEKSDPSKDEYKAMAPQDLEAERTRADELAAADQKLKEQAEVESMKMAEEVRIAAEARREHNRAFRSNLYRKTWFRLAVPSTLFVIIALVVGNQIVSDSMQAAEIEARTEAIRPITDAVSDCGVAEENVMFGDSYAKISTNNRTSLDCVLEKLTTKPLNELQLTAKPKQIGEFKFSTRGSWVTLENP